MKISPGHDWNLTPAQAVSLQHDLAAHLGLFLERPTIGCAKSRLYGLPAEPGQSRGSLADLLHPAGGEVIGCLVRTRTGVRPVYVSAGHLAELGWAVSLVLELAFRYRLPEPLRAAHRLAEDQRRRISGPAYDRFP